MNNKQIFKEDELEELKKFIGKENLKGKTIVWTNGCFDILHPGHLKTFEVAKGLTEDGNVKLPKNNVVVVGLNGDRSPYWKTKPGRPINSEEFRSKMLIGLKNIDYVYIFNEKNAAKPVNVLKPDIVLKGGDYYPLKISDNLIKGLSEYEKNKVKKLNNLIEKLTLNNGIVDVTGIYKYILSSGLDKFFSKKFSFIPEGLVNVQNGGKIILVSILDSYSTTNIIEKIRPKEFFSLIMLWEENKYRFKNLKSFLLWYLSDMDK